MTEPDPGPHGLMAKMRGDAGPLPPRYPPRLVGFAALGGFIAIAILAGLTEGVDELLILGSFGASCVLLFGFPDAPLSQPRNTIGGHVIATFVGLATLEVLGGHWWAMGIAVGLAIAAMMLTRTVHPPAGSNPVIVFLAAPAWSFLWFPTLIGAVIVVAVAVVYNNLVREERYPKYWIGDAL